MSEIRIGTSSFTAKGWDGPFYPRGMKAGERLSYYATQFDALEIDSTYYGTPTLSTVQRLVQEDTTRLSLCRQSTASHNARESTFALRPKSSLSF
jgi:uncharacterized protein YecE (DUF72 family)